MHQLVITGAMCSGKTTLLNSFAGNPRVNCVEDQARRYLETHPEHSRKTLESSRAIIKAYAEAAAGAAAQSDKPVCLSEGSVLNPVAHVQAWGNPRAAAILLDEIKPLLPKVKMFFLLDIEDIPYFRDAIRTESAAYRRLLQKTYKQLLEDLHLPYTLLSGAITIRHQRLEAYMDTLLA